MINYDVGPTNAALLINRNTVFNKKDLNFLEGIEEVKNDPIYKILSKYNLISIKPESLFDFLTKDIKNILKIEKLGDTEIDNTIRILTEYKHEYLEKYRNQVLVDLLKQGLIYEDTLAMLVLGDAYQKGVIIDQNYTEAYNIYQRLILNPGTLTRLFILSQALYYQAEMNHYGLGREVNLQKAISLYNKSLEYSKENFYLVYIQMKIAEYKNMYLKTMAKANLTDISLEEILAARIKKFEDDYIVTIVLFSLGFLTFILSMMKKRYQNYIDLYLKDVHI